MANSISLSFFMQRMGVREEMKTQSLQPVKSTRVIKIAGEPSTEEKIILKRIYRKQK